MTSPSHPHAQVQQINIYNHTYIKFLPGQNKLILNPDKTTCTMFMPDPAEYTSNLDIKIQNNALPMATHPNVLGLTLDPKLTYSTHIHNISVQTHNPLQIIRTLAATWWGKQKETLMATYKAVMRPALKYASSMWWKLKFIALLYIYIFSARTSSYWDVFQNITTPIDVLYITWLEPGKLASSMKLTNIIWVIFGIYTFVHKTA